MNCDFALQINSPAVFCPPFNANRPLKVWHDEPLIHIEKKKKKNQAQSFMSPDDNKEA